MRKMFTVTYALVTPESAEDGDYAETGFVEPGEWKTPIASALALDGDYHMTLREARDLCWPVYDEGYWFSNEADPDFETGAYETRNLHPPKNITPSSYYRLCRLFKI